MILEINNVRFAYQSSDVLKDISFTASNGEVIGILGKNGCGKTTLMKCINAHLRPHSGYVMIDGGHVSMMSKKDLAKNMAVVAQHVNLSSPFTVLETVMMGLYPTSEWLQQPTGDEMKRILEAMDSTSVTEFAERPVTELSGGEKQRVLIARALVQDPEIFLLDEPTLHLDINHQFNLMEMVNRLAREKNMLVIIVTHDISLAARYCDRVMLMEKGEIVGSGRTADVITSENLMKVFSVHADVTYDERINGLNVMFIGRKI
ncbi:MAG: ABC transporter ATP-binding protein [Methanomassiliicoccaceae archaeon]|jgi:iron complex transport system ATP-binding protein|nr:ABC transporter ATP-binding protein [Methanomassiliicoccaceae archaeon]